MSRAGQSPRCQRAQRLQQIPEEMVEMEVVGLAAELVAFESQAAIGRGMVLDARGGLSDAQNHPRSLRRVPGQAAVGVHVLGDIDDFRGIDDGPRGHFHRIRAEAPACA